MPPHGATARCFDADGEAEAVHVCVQTGHSGCFQCMVKLIKWNIMKVAISGSFQCVVKLINRTLWKLLCLQICSSVCSICDFFFQGGGRDWVSMVGVEGQRVSFIFPDFLCSQLEEVEYKPLDPKDIRLPPPMAPSERLLAAVDAFYTPPSRERPRDRWKRRVRLPVSSSVLLWSALNSCGDVVFKSLKKQSKQSREKGSLTRSVTLQFSVSEETSHCG